MECKLDSYLVIFLVVWIHAPGLRSPDRKTATDAAGDSHLDRPDVTDKTLLLVQNCKRINRLHLTGSQVTDKGMSVLSSLEISHNYKMKTWDVDISCQELFQSIYLP